MGGLWISRSWRGYSGDCWVMTSRAEFLDARQFRRRDPRALPSWRWPRQLRPDAVHCRNCAARAAARAPASRRPPATRAAAPARDSAPCSARCRLPFRSCCGSCGTHGAATSYFRAVLEGRSPCQPSSTANEALGGLRSQRLLQRFRRWGGLLCSRNPSSRADRRADAWLGGVLMDNQAERDGNQCGISRKDHRVAVLVHNYREFEQ